MRSLADIGLRLAALTTSLFCAGALAPAAAQAPELVMLTSLDKGQWELRFRDGSPSRKLCLHSGLEIIQIEHPESGCSRFVVNDGARDVTVQYTCRGNGYGRTNIRKETSALVQVKSQGIRGGMPFDVSAEARKIGACH